ncbi:hypothetical protein AB4853_40035 [Bradyrhizobium sp. 1050_B9_N1_2]|uniref:hypothetical protein n=1 Tax=Bradyrhizobium sp. 1050_B9_N1_2 TaxID=3238688 RepID=UPI003EDC7379
MLAKLLESELAARGVKSLAASDCEQIVERLVEQINDIELGFAARNVTGKPEPE